MGLWLAHGRNNMRLEGALNQNKGEERYEHALEVDVNNQTWHVHFGS